MPPSAWQKLLKWPFSCRAQPANKQKKIDFSTQSRWKLIFLSWQKMGENGNVAVAVNKGWTWSAVIDCPLGSRIKTLLSAGLFPWTWFVLLTATNCGPELSLDCMNEPDVARIELNDWFAYFAACPYESVWHVMSCVSRSIARVHLGDVTNQKNVFNYFNMLLIRVCSGWMLKTWIHGCD